MSSHENLVSGTNSPTHQGARATTDNCVHLVHLARCNLSCTCDHATSPKEQGGWDLANIETKCKTLQYARLWFLCTKNSSITTSLMRKWNLTGPIANPRNVHGLPTGITCIRHYALDMAYFPPPGPQEPMKKFKNRLYGATAPVSCGLPANTQESHGSEYGQMYTPPDFPTL